MKALAESQIEALLAAATRQAADFRFDLAAQALATAQKFGASERQLAASRQAVAQARQAERDAEEGDEEDRAAQQPLPPAPSLELYRRLGEWPAPDSRIDLLA